MGEGLKPHTDAQPGVFPENTMRRLYAGLEPVNIDPSGKDRSIREKGRLTPPQRSVSDHEPVRTGERAGPRESDNWLSLARLWERTSTNEQVETQSLRR